MSQKEISYTDIVNNFPLEGQYIFRFKFKHGKKIVWLDLQKKKERIPTFEGMIFMKVTRINWGSSALSTPQYETNDAEDLISDHSSQNQGAGIDLMNGNTAQAPQKEDLFEGFGDLSGMGNRT